MSITLEVNSKGPIILVDGSYFIFHRFFATLKWYKFKDDKIDGSSCLDVTEFKEAIIKHTRANIEKIRKKWALVEEGKKRVTRKDWENIQIWFGLDCHRTEIWRTQIVDGYKGTRDKNANRDSIDRRVFDLLYTDLIKMNDLFMLEIDGLEADDIIALTHKNLRNNGYTGKIVCITNDNDYLQLYDDNTMIYNLDEKDLRTRSCGDPKKDLLLKIIIGDKSDNIKPVRDKLNEKKLKDLLHQNEEEIISQLCLNDKEKDVFELNRKLIDFSYIPGKFVECYDNKYSIKVCL